MDQNDLFDKNYFRVYLKEIAGEPVIVSGKFKMIHENHLTFTTIRPYIKGCHSKTICNHLNILRDECQKYLDVSRIIKNQKFYLIGYFRAYPSDPDRYGMVLSPSIFTPPIMNCEDFMKIVDGIYNRCHKFDKEKWYRP
jgi:hypothetical protein